MWDYLLDHTFRWILVILVFILNFVVYYYDPDRWKNSLCFGISCKWFAYLIAMIRYTIDVLIVLGLFYTIKLTFMDNFNPIWFTPVILIGYAVITQIAIDTPDKVELKEKIRPPDYMLSKNSHLMLLLVVMALNIIIFLQLYIASGFNKEHQTGFDLLIGNRFGGWNEDNKLKVVIEWLAILAVSADLYAIYANRAHSDCHQ